MKREEILVVMLSRYDEARALNGPDGIRGDGDGYPRLPATWNASYRELERCLLAMRRENYDLYRHVTGRFIGRAEGVSLIAVINGKPVVPENMEIAAGHVESGDRWARFRVYKWPAWVDDRLVRDGVAWLSGRFQGEPFLPREFTEAA